MSEPVYVIMLGTGLYLDDQGILHQGPVPAVPAYPLPGGLLTTASDLSKLSTTFREIGGAMPVVPDADSDDDTKAKFADFSAKLTKLGLPGDDMAKLLGAVGKIAEAVGTVFVALGAAVAAAKMLGLFSEGPSPLEQLVTTRFNALESQIRALQDLNIQKHLAEHRNALIAARSAAQDFIGQRDAGTMTATQIETRAQLLATELQRDSSARVLSLLNTVSYMPLFDTKQYSKVWPWISSHLFHVPAGSPPINAAFREENKAFFDHRLAMLFAPEAAQTFLAMVRSLSPEFRTTGDFHSTLRDFANELNKLAAAIRNTALARTIYTESDFASPIPDFYVNDPLPGFIDPELNSDYFMVVGAMDLCNHNDAFFPNVQKGFGVPAALPSRQGSFDFRWRPPARIVRDPLPSGLVHQDGTPVVNYRVTNQKECADAANDLSLQDYSDLLLSSGYLTLVQLEAQMRHAATQPDTSETVHCDLLLQRRPEAGSKVTVVSAPGPVVFTRTGEIRAEAWREPQKVRAFAAATTQRLPRTAPLIHYRVLLRTLASGFPPNGWVDPSYQSVQSASYTGDRFNPGFQRLVLSTSFDAVLHEELLFEGSSRTELRHFEKTLEFRAHTFDWWIPTKPLPGLGESASASARTPIAGLLPKSPIKVPQGGLPKPSPRLSGDTSIEASRGATLVLGLGWEDGAQSWQGHHREMQDTTVKLRVRADWKGSQLHAVIENDPQDRNYVVFLVVEETFGLVEPDEHGPKVLHTALPIPINGQLTFVPQSLFDEEAEASARQRAFAQDFAVSVDPKPGEPVLGSISMAELSTDAGAQRLAATLRQFHLGLLPDPPIQTPARGSQLAQERGKVDGSDYSRAGDT